VKPFTICHRFIFAEFSPGWRRGRPVLIFTESWARAWPVAGFSVLFALAGGGWVAAAAGAACVEFETELT
jgi:hypothetical protein